MCMYEVLLFALTILFSPEMEQVSYCLKYSAMLAQFT